MPPVRQYGASPLGEHVFLKDVTQGLIDAQAEEALEVFKAFASGALVDEGFYVLDCVSCNRVAIAPAVLRAKYRKE